MDKGNPAVCALFDAIDVLGFALGTEQEVLRFLKG